MLVGADQADLVGNSFIHKAIQCRGISVLNDTQYDVALAADRADNGCLAGTGTASAAIVLVPILIMDLAADVSFVNFDDASKLVGLVLTQCSANAIAHIERGLVRTETHVAHDLEGADAFLLVSIR